MKMLLSFILTLSFSAFGKDQLCEGSNCYIAGTSMAATMVSGYKGVKNAIKASDLEKKFTIEIFRRSASNGGASTSMMLAQIQEGDRVQIRYELSERANLRHHIRILEDSIDSARSEASSYRAKAIVALLPQTETYLEDGVSKTRVVPGSASEALRYNNYASDADRRATRIIRELDDVHAGRAQVKVYRFDLVVKNTSGVQVGGKLTLLAKDGSKPVYISRISKEALTKIGKASRNGWVLIATAATLGIITAEEALSGSIGRKLDKELEELRGK